MHEGQTIITDERGVSLSVARLNQWCTQCVGASFAELLWPLVENALDVLPDLPFMLGEVNGCINYS